MLIYNSVGLIALDVGSIISDELHSVIDAPLTEHQENVLFALEELGTSVPNLPPPKIVYAHIVFPHPPSIFDADGKIIKPTGPYTLGDKDDAQSKQDEDPEFRHQIKYLNERVIKLVKGILERSSSPPIIIIQSDHGGGNTHTEHMAILMAIKFPQNKTDQLYETITPVNVFRIVFNQYFGANYGMLDDMSYYSYYHTWFEFIEIPNDWGS
jgi:hypothetical protein